MKRRLIASALHKKRAWHNIINLREGNSGGEYDTLRGTRKQGGNNYGREIPGAV
jgi:hypothetical protein